MDANVETQPQVEACGRGLSAGVNVGTVPDGQGKK